VKKANKTLGMIKQSFSDRCGDLVVKMYTVATRHHMVHSWALANWIPPESFASMASVNLMKRPELELLCCM